MLLDVRVHDRPEVEILDVSEQVDDEHLAEIPGSLEASALPPALNRLFLLQGMANRQCFI